MEDYKKTQTKDCPDCDGVGHFKDASECCGADIDEDILICHACKEHSGFAECENCNGKGFLDMTDEEIQMEEDARKDNEAEMNHD